MKWLTVASVQVGQVVANTQPADWYHWPDDGRTGQPLPRPGHHHLHLRCDGQGAVPWAVHRLLQQATWRHAALELRRFPARVHDRVPCVVWRVDRVHVGMSRRLRAHLHPVLPPHHDHRKSRRTCLLTHCARLSVMLWGASRVVGVVSILHTLPMLNRPCWQHWWCQSSWQLDLIPPRYRPATSCLASDAIGLQRVQTWAVPPWENYIPLQPWTFLVYEN